MAEFLEVMNEFKRMCDSSYQCLECPLQKSLPKPMFCWDKLAQEPEKSEMIIMAWAKHHPRKTMEDVLFEKQPVVVNMMTQGARVCPRHYNPAWGGLCDDGKGNKCRECWRRPVPEGGC